jgi:Tfp pilus assembly protein PilX
MTHAQSSHFHHGQRGATLLVSLIMLVLLTMFAVAGFNLSSVNLKIAGNFQQLRNVEMAAQQAIEQVISKADSFTTPASQTITVNGIAVSVTVPVCYHSATAPEYELNYDTPAPQDNIWEFKATATDTLGGAKAAITQGVALRMLPGNCL